jgi:hypothetical protein
MGMGIWLVFVIGFWLGTISAFVIEWLVEGRYK